MARGCMVPARARITQCRGHSAGSCALQSQTMALAAQTSEWMPRSGFCAVCKQALGLQNSITSFRDPPPSSRSLAQCHPCLHFLLQIHTADPSLVMCSPPIHCYDET